MAPHMSIKVLLEVRARLRGKLSRKLRREERTAHLLRGIMVRHALSMGGDPVVRRESGRHTRDLLLREAIRALLV